MTKDFEQAIAHFKPIFGNDKHLTAIKLIGNLREKEKRYKRLKIKSPALLTEIERDEANIIYNLK